MKTLFLFSVLFAYLLLRHKPEKIVTILIAGQSNAWSAAMQPSDLGYSTTGKVSVAYLDKPEVFPTRESPITDSIAWIKLGDLLATEKHCRVRIVNVAVGSTTSQEWADDLVWRIRAAIWRFHPDYIIWVQGEFDTANNFEATKIYRNYEKIIGETEGIPFYCAIDGYYLGQNSRNTRVAQLKIIVDGLALKGVDVDKLRNHYYATEDLMHFTGVGFDVFANDWFQILRYRK